MKKNNNHRNLQSTSSTPSLLSGILGEESGEGIGAKRGTPDSDTGHDSDSSMDMSGTDQMQNANNIQQPTHIQRTENATDVSITRGKQRILTVSEKFTKNENVEKWNRIKPRGFAGVFKFPHPEVEITIVVFANADGEPEVPRYGKCFVPMAPEIGQDKKKTDVPSNNLFDVL